MLDDVKRNITSIKILIGLAICALALHLFQILWNVLGSFSDIFIILFVAWIVGFIFEPFVDSIQDTFRINKITAASIVYVFSFLVIAAIIFQFVPVVSSQIDGLTSVIPRYINSIPPFMQKWASAATSYLDNSILILPSLAQFVINLFLVLIISFYFIIDRDHLNHELFRIIPASQHENLRYIQEVIDKVFASFLRVQLLFGLLGGIGTWVILTIFQVDFAMSTALMSGLLTIIPLIGGVMALFPPLIIPLLTNNPTEAIIIFALLIIMQQIIFNVVGPKILSKAFKLHPVVVILSFLVGYKIAGGMGAIFAIPVLGILTVVLHKLTHHFLKTDG